VSHLRDAASWYWPGETCWHGPFVGRGVEPSQVEAGAAEAPDYEEGVNSKCFSAIEREKGRKWGKTEAGMDHMQITMYAKARCLSCWRTKRLLRRRGYAFEMVEVVADGERRAWLSKSTSRKELPAVFVDGRLVGSFEIIKALERSGNLDRLVRGEV
jgi:glutaredoxin 3